MIEELGSHEGRDKEPSPDATKDSIAAPPPSVPPGQQPDWTVIRKEYETSPDTVVTICRRHGVTSSALQWRRKHHHWPKRNGSVALRRPDLITRMFRVFERHVDELEGNMNQTGEKEAQLLGNLARTLEKLIELDTREATPGKNDKRQAQMADLREKLVRRIGQLGGRSGS